MSAPAESLAAQVDRDACQGHGRCYLAAPDTFESDDEGYPVVIVAAETPAQLAALRRAMRNCPERAISPTPSEATAVSAGRTTDA